MRSIISNLAILSIAALAPAVALGEDKEDRAAAQQIATVLRDSGQLQNYSVGVKYKNGTVWLSGKVISEQQMQAALQVVSDIDGVTQIVNNLSTSAKPPAAGAKQSLASKSNRQPQGKRPSARRVSATSADTDTPITTAGGAIEQDDAAGGDMADGNVAPAGYHRLKHAARVAPPAAVYSPVGGGGGPIPAAYDQPHMPGYAWPSYAAYPNYAALSYPKQYSPTAFPFIGPFYPYPQVPLGWRKVSLEWDDGWWFLDFQDRNHH
jgi:hypothetical protein